MDKRLKAIVDAWTDAGPAPIIHRIAQSELRREWPTLARALDDMAAFQGKPQAGS